MSFRRSDLATVQIKTFDMADREQTPVKIIGDPYCTGKNQVIVFVQPIPEDPKSQKAIDIFECAYFALDDSWDQTQ